MEQDDSVTGSEIVLDGPANGEGRLIGEVDGNADLTSSTGGGGGGGGRGRVVRGRGMVDLDCWELRVVTVIRRIHFVLGFSFLFLFWVLFSFGFC